MTSPPTIPRHGLHCEAVGPAPSLSVDFAPRLNLFTGDNGLGKTFMLDVAWWMLTGTWVDRPATPHSTPARAALRMRVDGESLDAASYNPAREAWSRPTTWPAIDTLVLYARVDGGISIWDPLIARLVEADPRATTIHLSPIELWQGAKVDDTVLCNGLLSDWLQWQARHPETFTRFFGVVRALFEADAEVEPGDAVPLGLRDAREFPTLRFPYADVPVPLLSAGMKRVLGLAYVITWAFERHLRARTQQSLDPTPSGVIVLIDEVEAHLHPRWQRALLPSVLRQLESLRGEPDVQLLATTHAPFVTASCETIFDEERDALFVFGVSGDQITLEPMPWARHGDITNWVTSDVFGLERGRSLEAERAIRAALAHMRGEPTEDPELTTREQIHARLRHVLSDTDEFWAHWISSATDGAAQ